MGRSNSCFKVMTCANSDIDGDDMESKSSADKRRWSFGKRSARHRVLNNTVTTETHSSGNLEIPESNVERPDDSEKVPVKQITDGKRQLSSLMNSEPNFSTQEDPEPKLSTSVDLEVPRLSTSLDSKVNETTIITEKQSEDSVEIDESSVIIIQAAVRGFLDRRKLLKYKNVVKLQAAVRGHLVRGHASGTLRCVQAIVKMQALVRARHARHSLEGSCTENKIEEKHENDDDNSKTSDKETSGTKSDKTSYTSVEKLLSNKFARQLMESTPKKKAINFKCDSSKPNSAWNWLERWMSVSSVEPKKTEELITEQTENTKLENHSSLIENKDPSEISGHPSESEDNMIIYDENNFNFQSSRQISLPQLDFTTPSDVEEILVEEATLPNETVQPDVISQTEPEIENEQPKNFTEMEGKKFGSRKSSNPSFIAAQSKFEELSSSANSGKINSPSSQIESNNDMVSPVLVENEHSMTENSIPHNSSVLVGDSECGTELSVTSTLDSPDRYETKAISESEVKDLEEVKQNPDTKKTDDVEAIDDSSYSVSDQFAKFDDTDCGSKIVVTEKEELKIEENVPGHQNNSLSPEASPTRSYLTIPESQGTPSSEVSSSVKPKKKKTSNHRKSSSHKLSPLSVEKRSPSNHHQDSSQSAKDEKNGKRRNSFGSATKPDHHNIVADQETKESDSSLPRFMQPTHSARAKVNTSSSPRSSSDVQQHDGEVVYSKKRHSLPGANGRQGSPRIQRSLSQEQQGAKEKRWVR